MLSRHAGKGKANSFTFTDVAWLKLRPLDPKPMSTLSWLNALLVYNRASAPPPAKWPFPAFAGMSQGCHQRHFSGFFHYSLLFHRTNRASRRTFIEFSVPRLEIHTTNITSKHSEACCSLDLLMCLLSYIKDSKFIVQFTRFKPTSREIQDQPKTIFKNIPNFSYSLFHPRGRRVAGCHALLELGSVWQGAGGTDKGPCIREADCRTDGRNIAVGVDL